jgi:hypothetical protein
LRAGGGGGGKRVGVGRAVLILGDVDVVVVVGEVVDGGAGGGVVVGEGKPEERKVGGEQV